MIQRLPIVGLSLVFAVCDSPNPTVPSSAVQSESTQEPVVLPPEAPAIPTNIQVSDRGFDFIEWSWDSVENATSYQAHAYLSGTPSDQRPPLQTVVEPVFLARGLEQLTLYTMHVRAVSETAGGRAVGLWARGLSTSTLPPPPGPLASCKSQRQRALDWEHDATLVAKWNPDQPFRVWVDEERIRRGGNRIGRPDFLQEEVLEPLRDVADRLEDRLGYAIFDPYDLLFSRPLVGDAIRIERRVAPERNPPWGGSNCTPGGQSPMNARPRWATVWYNDPYFFDPTITCSGYVGDRIAETVIHELIHLFGTKHAQSVGDANSRTFGGVFMSEPLTRHRGYGESDLFLLTEDIDNIGCIFPHPEFPR